MEETSLTAYKDQFDAASDDANNALNEIAESAVEEDDVSAIESGELPPDVVWSSFLGSRFKWVDDPSLMKRLTYCTHASLKSPAVFVVGANKPNHVDCIHCGAKRRSRILKQNKIPCDLCEKKDLTEGFHELILQAGAFVIAAILCSDCQTEQDRSVEILTDQYNELMKEQEDAQDD
jgi:hypothetical protein